jgi:hypothetical protein
MIWESNQLTSCRDEENGVPEDAETAAAAHTQGIRTQNLGGYWRTGPIEP